MSKYQWGTLSRARLSTCHPLLQILADRVVARADLPCDLTIVCGHRDRQAQNDAVRHGFSQARWPTSKHNQLPSHALDFAPLDCASKIDWVNEAGWQKTGPIFEEEWALMQVEGLVPVGVTLSWGGRWKSFRDLPHVELRGV